MERKLPWVKYLLFFIGNLGLTLAFHHLELGFTTVALPLCLSLAAPLIHTFFHLCFLNKTTRLQKILGVVFFFEALHCINFALFRMDPDAQLWGWFVTYVLFDLLAILLPSIALEKASITENERLQGLVTERTLKLDRLLQTNKSLFKVLIHDINNPLMSIKSYFYLFEKNGIDSKQLITKLNKSQIALEEIVSKMKSIYFLENKSQIPLTPVPLDECLKDVHFLFEEKLRQKEIELVIRNSTPSFTYALADKTSLVHSVLGNIVNNAIKFNQAHSKIFIRAEARSGKIIIEVEDEGPGIDEEIVAKVFEDQELTSTEGTLGESGSGLGLSIIKSFVSYYNGSLEFISRHKSNDGVSFGTIVRVILHETSE